MPARQRAQPLGHVIQLLLAPRHDGYICPRDRQAFRQLEPQPDGGSCDQRHLALQSEHVL